MCGHRYRSDVRDVVDDASLRASQTERERAVERLRDHAGEGRLELEELEERIERALHARTRGDLRALFADLPDERRSRRSSSGAVRTLAAGSAVAALLPLAAAILLLSLAPPAIAWMGWPLLGWWFFASLPAAGFGFAACGHSRRRRARRTVVV
jgi:hypothetical protein